jgi:hypothetical protein
LRSTSESSKQVRETITASGHPNITATHPSTLMFTKDTYVSENGDCVIAIAADKALTDLSTEFKEKLRKPNSKLTITIETDNLKEKVTAFGSPRLILNHATEMVVRKSDYISDRTLAVHADKAAIDLSRPFIEKLKNPKQQVKLTILVEA